EACRQEHYGRRSIAESRACRYQRGPAERAEESGAGPNRAEQIAGIGRGLMKGPDQKCRRPGEKRGAACAHRRHADEHPAKERSLLPKVSGCFACGAEVTRLGAARRLPQCTIK